MLKVLKWIFGIIITLLILLVLGVGLFFWLINPNDYKSEIEQWASDNAHLNLSIPGLLEWTFWPEIGIKTSELQLQTQSKGEQDASKHPTLVLKSVALGISPWAMFKGSLASDVDLKAASLAYEPFLLHDVHIEAKGLTLGSPFPFDLSGTLQEGFAKPIHFDLSSTVLIQTSADVPQQQKVLLSQLQANFNHSQVTGQFSLVDFAKPVMDLSLHSPTFEVSDWVNLKGKQLILKRFALNAHLMLEGTGPNDIPSTLNGGVKMTVDQMTLTGIDVGKVIDGIRASLSMIFSGGTAALPAVSNLPQLLTIAHPDQKTQAISEGDSQLGAFLLESDIRNGVVRSDRILLSGDHFEVKGNGLLDLNTKTLDYRFDVYGMNGKTPDSYTIPFKVDGKMDDPSMGIDYPVLMLQVHKILEDQLKNTLVNTVSTGVPAVADHLKGLVGGLLGQ
jgi:AsmA family/AsmA-like C-terminal region